MTEIDKAARYDELRTKPDLTDDEQIELDALAAEFSPPPVDPDPATVDGGPKSSRRRSRKDEGDPEKRYCAYDLSHGRFVGAVGTKADARQVIEHSATGHDFEIREV